jgi:hypothetical protein
MRIHPPKASPTLHATVYSADTLFLKSDDMGMDKVRKSVTWKNELLDDRSKTIFPPMKIDSRLTNGRTRPQMQRTLLRPLRLESIEEQGAGGHHDQGAAQPDQGEADEDERPQEGEGGCYIAACVCMWRLGSRTEGVSQQISGGGRARARVHDSVPTQVPPRATHRHGTHIHPPTFHVLSGGRRRRGGGGRRRKGGGHGPEPHKGQANEEEADGDGVLVAPAVA